MRLFNILLSLSLVNFTLAAPAAPATPGAKPVAAAATPPAAEGPQAAVPATPAPVADTTGPVIKFVNLPKELILNDREHPVKVQYSGIGAGPADIHVDIIGDGGFTWFGGGQLSVVGPAGEADVPIEIRVPSYYGGPLSLRAFVAPEGKAFNAALATTDEQVVTISKVPVDAIGVLCQPRMVTPGVPFTLNLWFTQTHARESDIIAVALHADTKEYFGGFQITVKEQQGHVSGHFDFHPGSPDLPLKFKAWISPKGEKAPNYVSYTMINVPLGAKLEQDCPQTPNNEWTPTGTLPANWIELHDIPKEISPGETLKVDLTYNLAADEAAEATVALMTWDWITHEATEIVSNKVKITPAENAVTVDLAVPADAKPGRDGAFAISYIGDLAEDRVYETTLLAPGVPKGATPAAPAAEGAPAAEAAVGADGAVAQAEGAVAGAVAAATKAQERFSQWLRRPN